MLTPLFGFRVPAWKKGNRPSFPIRLNTRPGSPSKSFREIAPEAARPPHKMYGGQSAQWGTRYLNRLRDLGSS